MSTRIARPGGEPVAWVWAAADRHPAWIWAVTAGGLGALALALLVLPPIDIHGPLHYVGIMGPLCGMTRAVRSITRGDVATAMRFNPAVWLLPLATGVVIARTLWGRLTGRWLEASIRWKHPMVAVPLMAAILILTIRQQAHVDLLGP